MPPISSPILKRLWQTYKDRLKMPTETGAFAPRKRFAEQNLGAGVIHSPRA